MSSSQAALVPASTEQAKLEQAIAELTQALAADRAERQGLRQLADAARATGLLQDAQQYETRADTILAIINTTSERLNRLEARLNPAPAAALQVSSEAPFVCGKLAGTHESYKIIHSLDVKTIFTELCSMNAGRCEGARIQKVLHQRIVSVPGSQNISEEVVLDLNPGDPVKNEAEIVLVPHFHQYVFVFRTLAQDQSLRVLAKSLAKNMHDTSEQSIPISGHVRRISSIDLEVTIRAPFKRLIDDVLHRFRNAPEHVPQGRNVSIQVDEPRYTKGIGVLHSHFEVLKYGGDLRRADGMPSDDEPTSDVWSLASDDVAAMYPFYN
ncbi:hypothetical protein CAOG_03545 [Capsaspora owczarzaki ATCC 30864]|uniref:Uncharacterized protein n=1 Tax=Capsaspora owczarzaki (strain ATCC 30864) TaxID=595528 RepID=A0A0D2UCA9_CAPO3|nr:hypothetical protein CAOG_03545 [Capsaspora owczarzaki ATCC 30864]KJE92621.1 hypothetical protein CAOG_003545 [Capsaspora owczarzaki ATCC 30864]|eukprot:XP_004348453.1 hypothetical protein CAOG_03545 [Capsaspora owczarzaki ATCC 30864]